MITIPRSVRIFIGSTPFGMRKSIDRLMAIVQEEPAQDAYSGHLFVFVSRRCDRVETFGMRVTPPTRPGQFQRIFTLRE